MYALLHLGTLLHQFLSLIVESEVVKDGRLGLILGKNAEHLLSGIEHDLLCVTRVGDGLVLVICEQDMPV